MTRSVKRTGRSYDNATRRAQSEQTRHRILDAARDLLVSTGYRATTVTQIAQEADVHVDTIYALVGRKPEILRALIEHAISGTGQPLPPEARDYVQRMQAEPDPVRKLDIYASAVRAIQTRMAPLLLALRDAASTEPQAEQVWSQISQRRAANMRRLVADLGDDALRPGLDLDAAADIVWATASSEMFVLLTGERGWTLDRYQDWLADAWRRLLLEPDTAR